MKCDLCDNESTVHEVTVKGGVKIERHLCESCAAEQGIGMQAGNPVELLKSMLQPKTRAAAPPTKAAACPTCGITFSDFKSAGVLGCPECYATFESQLAGLIERAHEGATQHVGKVPRESAGGPRPAIAEAIEERAQRVAAIRRMLEEAVRAEQYERAAQLRDELRKMTELGRAGGTLS